MVHKLGLKGYINRWSTLHVIIIFRVGSLELTLSSLPLLSNFLGGGGISSLVVVRAFSSASPSSVHAGEGDVRHFHWSAFIFLPFSNKLVQEVQRQEKFLLLNLHLMYQFCGYVCFREIYSWSFFDNQIDWFLSIRGVDFLGWFFEQPLLNDVSTGDSSFLPTNFHEGKMKRMVGFLLWPQLPHIHVYHFKVSMYYHLNFLFCRPILYYHFLV